MPITIITDGSADNRTGIGGWAAIVRSSDTLTELTGYAEGTTSNRMELTAVIEGLRHIQIPSQIEIVADSAYVLNSIRNQWYLRWIEEDEDRLTKIINGSKLIPRLRPNMDLWRMLNGLCHYHDVAPIKIKGHSGDYWNERADKLAGMARLQQGIAHHQIVDWREGTKCEELSLSGQQCKLHASHSGDCYYTKGKVNGVEVYGT